MILEDSKGLEKIIEYSKKGSKMSMEYSKDSDKIPICLNFVDLVIVLQKVGTKLLVFARSYKFSDIGHCSAQINTNMLTFCWFGHDFLVVRLQFLYHLIVVMFRKVNVGSRQFGHFLFNNHWSCWITRYWLVCITPSRPKLYNA